jgi:transcription-repair coupling factor (superfamily II helicase)
VPAGFVSPFQPGELVVHATHGVSRYAGTRLLQAGDGSKAEYIQLDYADGDRVFVPIEHVDRLSKHIGEEVGLTRLSAAVERRTPYTRFPKPPTQAEPK